MDVILNLTTTDTDGLCREIFGKANPESGAKATISEDVTVQFRKKQPRSMQDYAPTVVGLIVSIPTGVLTSLATDKIKRVLGNEDPQGQIKSIEIIYTEAGRTLKKRLEYENS